MPYRCMAFRAWVSSVSMWHLQQGVITLAVGRWRRLKGQGGWHLSYRPYGAGQSVNMVEDHRGRDGTVLQRQLTGHTDPFHAMLLQRQQNLHKGPISLGGLHEPGFHCGKGSG